MEAQNLLANSRVNMTAKGKRRLGAVIESTEYLDKYVKDLVKDWDNHLTILSTIAETQPQAAYFVLAIMIKSKLKYFLRTITNIHHLLLLLERTIRNKVILAVTGGYMCWKEKEKSTNFSTNQVRWIGHSNIS